MIRLGFTNDPPSNTGIMPPATSAPRATADNTDTYAAGWDAAFQTLATPTTDQLVNWLRANQTTVFMVAALLAALGIFGGRRR